MMKKKKGISPLLATVLLVAFVIIIAVIIWLWWANVLREQVQKEGQKTELKSICEGQIDFNIKESTSCEVISGVKRVHLFLENKGTSSIDNFKVQVVDNNGGTMDKFLDQSAIEGGALEASADFSGITGTLTKVVVYPIVSREGNYMVCGDQANELEISC